MYRFYILTNQISDGRYSKFNKKTQLLRKSSFSPSRDGMKIRSKALFRIRQVSETYRYSNLDPLRDESFPYAEKLAIYCKP